jgi:hypothetical protein
MERLSVPLALQDFIPVLISAVGWYFVVRVTDGANAAAGRLATIGAVLVVLGGLSRAVWKLTVALDGPDLSLLHAGLYPLLTAGFLTLAGALWAASSARAPGRLAWLGPLVLVAGLAAISWLLDPGNGRLVPVVWLGVATVGLIAVSGLLALRAWNLGRRGVAALFVIGIVATILLNGLARVAEQDEAVQWTEQGLNTVNQLLFAVAAWRLWLAERPASRPTR